jgi:hypothetical protein
VKLPALTLHLYTSEQSGKLTEMQGYGYNPIELNPNEWTYQDITATYAPQTFRFTGAAGKVEGWYTTLSNGGIMSSCPFLPPVDIKTSGDSLVIEPSAMIVAAGV